MPYFQSVEKLSVLVIPGHPRIFRLCFGCASGVSMRAKLNQRTVSALQPSGAPYDVRDTSIAGFLLRVQPKSQKSPDGRRAWFYQYRTRQGDQTRIKLGDFPGLSAEAARAMALEHATDAGKGVDLVARKRAERAEGERAKHRTLAAFLDNRYEPWAKAHLKSAAFQISRLRSDFAAWLERPMGDLNTFAIEGMRQRWRKAGMQPRSINRDVQRLQSVLSRAVEWGVLIKHPLAGLKPLKADKTGRVRFLTAEEEAALREALRTREEGLRQARIRFNAWRVARGKKPLPEREGDYLDHLRPLVIVSLNTGLRRGELLGLTWGSVNFSGRMLTVTAATAKSGHTRRVPLNAEALEVLTAWHQRQGKPKADALVFRGHDGERMKRIDTSWESLMKAAKLKNFRLHDCRHHFASKLVQAGVDLYTVKELLGHSEIAMTERYSHLAPDNLRAAVERVAG
jgi:integrase